MELSRWVVPISIAFLRLAHVTTGVQLLIDLAVLKTCLLKLPGDTLVTAG